MRPELQGLNADQLRGVVDYLDDALRGLNAGPNGEIRSLSDDEQTRFDDGLALRQEAHALLERHAQIATLPAAATVAGDGATRGAPNSIVREDPYNLDNVRFTAFDGRETRHAVMRDHALRAIDSEDSLDDSHKRRVEQLVRSLPEVAERVLVTGTPGYRAAWMKAYQAAARGQMPLLTAEDSKYLERAASLTSNAGGYAVPFLLDPTVILTNVGSSNPFRRISNVKTITSNKWNGVSSAGITVSWDGEAGEVSDDTPTLAQPAITAWKAQGFVPFSIEIDQDWTGFEAEMRREFADARDNLEATAFATGAG
jgi:hypothetical protein